MSLAMENYKMLTLENQRFFLNRKARKISLKMKKKEIENTTTQVPLLFKHCLEHLQYQTTITELSIIDYTLCSDQLKILFKNTKNWKLKILKLENNNLAFN